MEKQHHEVNPTIERTMEAMLSIHAVHSWGSGSSRIPRAWASAVVPGSEVKEDDDDEEEEEEEEEEKLD